MSSIINFIFSRSNKLFVYIFVAFYTFLIVQVTLRMGYRMGIYFSLIPLAVIFILMLVEHPFIGFSLLFIANYYMSGLARYFTNISTGIFVDYILIVIIVTLVIGFLFNQKSEFKLSNAFNYLTLAALIWFAYCVLQIANPNSTSLYAWLQSARGIGIYFFVIVTVSSIILRRFKDFKRLLVLWGILSLTAVLKAYIQKTYGFDSAEMRWLIEGGGSRTHFINTGIRYFSFYTDAANFGTGIAFAGVVFAVTSFYTEKMITRIFFLFCSGVCAYGMMISGTRGSLAVPFMGLMSFVLLSRNAKAIIIALVIVGSSFAILRYTDWGSYNTYVRRMRTAFDPNDPSFKVRKENQAKLRTYMWSKPFGAGIGMARKRSEKYAPDPYLAKIPTDSWYVLIWVETGIFGLMLHALILLYIIFHGSYLVLFKLKDPRLKGMITALICGISGIYVSAYSIEIIGQFPTGFILYICMAIIFLSPVYDKELEAKRNKLLLPDGIKA